MYQANEITKKFMTIKGIQFSYNTKWILYLWIMNIAKLLTWKDYLLDLKRNDKYVALSNLSMYYTWKNIIKSYNNNKFKIPAPSWNDIFEFRDDSYFVSDI